MKYPIRLAEDNIHVKRGVVRNDPLHLVGSDYIVKFRQTIHDGVWTRVKNIAAKSIDIFHSTPFIIHTSYFLEYTMSLSKRTGIWHSVIVCKCYSLALTCKSGPSTRNQRLTSRQESSKYGALGHESENSCLYLKGYTNEVTYTSLMSLAASLGKPVVFVSTSTENILN